MKLLAYIVYGPLLQGCTTILYEGKPVGTPDASSFWRMISNYNIKTLMCAPTTLRAIKQFDPKLLYLNKYNINSLKYIFLAGERCDPNTLKWIINHLPNNLNIQVIDHWWQTETGWPITGRMMFANNNNNNNNNIKLLPQCIGSAGKPIPGMHLECVNAYFDNDNKNNSNIDTITSIPWHNIKKCSINETGEFVLKLPLPPGTLGGCWGNNIRVHKSYLEKYPGYYISGDTGFIDKNGFVHVMSRSHDLINVSGHRLSTASIETVLSEHNAIAEACVIGVPHNIKQMLSK